VLFLPRCGASSSPFMEASRDDLEACATAHERGLARVIVTGAGRHVSGAGPVPVISMAVHGARRKTACIARRGCLRKHT
jgi:hypothetical protein